METEHEVQSVIHSLTSTLKPLTVKVISADHCATTGKTENLRMWNSLT